MEETMPNVNEKLFSKKIIYTNIALITLSLIAGLFLIISAVTPRGINSIFMHLYFIVLMILLVLLLIYAVYSFINSISLKAKRENFLKSISFSFVNFIIIIISLYIPYLSYFIGSKIGKISEAGYEFMIIIPAGFSLIPGFILLSIIIGIMSLTQKTENQPLEYKDDGITSEKSKKIIQIFTYFFWFLSTAYALTMFFLINRLGELTPYSEPHKTLSSIILYLGFFPTSFLLFFIFSMGYAVYQKTKQISFSKSTTNHIITSLIFFISYAGISIYSKYSRHIVKTGDWLGLLGSIIIPGLVAVLVINGIISFIQKNNSQ